ncbi:MAG TPA: hypothetical protein VMU88_02980 [bacterium]|nr:hypothetical protein [bacterium]
MTRAWTLNQVNYLNVGLMALSAALAFRFPFELFIFAYTVLGPLHYLTEISWLKDRGFYTQGRYDYLVLVVVGAVVTALTFHWMGPSPKGAGEFLAASAFFGAFCLAFLKSPLARLGAFLPALALAGLFCLSPFAFALFGVFLPTLIHVFVFTGCFIWAGALRSKSFSGYLSLAVFLGLGGFLLFFHGGGHLGASAYARENYGVFQADGSPTNPFIGLNFMTLQSLGFHQFGRPAGSLADFADGINRYLYQDPAALAVMAFIAYAYTYHYLNWFSKTSVIRWHEMPRKRLGLILGIWVLSLGLSAWNYQTGFRWLFFLSFTHVLLEFPLNHLTFLGIGRALLGFKKTPAEAG